MSSRDERLAGCAARRMSGVVVVLDELEDLGNRAAILRTVEALGFLAVHEIGAPPSRAGGAERSIINGGEKFLQVTRWADAASCFAALRTGGVDQVLVALPPRRGADGDADEPEPEPEPQPQPASRRLDGVDFARRTALVFGNERNGVTAEAIALADGAFHVPMYGLCESLNVSVTVAIALASARAARATALGLGPEQGDLEPEARAALAERYSALSGGFTKHLRAQRKKEHEVPPPPALESFVEPALRVHAALMHQEGAATEQEGKEGEGMAYAELAMSAWLVLQVFGVASRARALRTARWGHEIARLPDGDWRIALAAEGGGDRGGGLEVRLSELRPLGAVGLLRPELAAAALERLLSATVGETEGRVVFSHSSTEGEIRKKDKFGKFFAARIGEGMDCVMFRERLERAADSLLDAGTIGAGERGLLARLLA